MTTDPKDAVEDLNADVDRNFEQANGSDLTSGEATENATGGQPPIARDDKTIGASNVGSPPRDGDAR